MTVKTYTIQKVAALAKWYRYKGFTGETCSECKKTANVTAFWMGWYCNCGAFNMLSNLFSASHVHEKPDLGPTKAVILAGEKDRRK